MERGLEAMGPDALDLAVRICRYDLQGRQFHSCLRINRSEGRNGQSDYSD